MLCLFSCLSLSYVKSQFGFPGTDTVMAQEHDSFEVLATNLPIPTVKNIRERTDFANPQITSDDQYPWPGHNYKCSDASINTEKAEMNKRFCRAYKPGELTQENAFYHPAGILQWTRNKTFIKEIQEAPRIKLKMYINSRIHTPHWTSVYAMPGELITVEIPKFLVNKAKIKLNHQAEESQGNVKWRLPAARCEFPLKYEKNVFAWPIGGAMDITVWGDSHNDGIEVTITGGIRMPHFRYGVNTDQEWEEELREYRAPLAVVDPGAILELFPADRARRQVKLNDACAFWRTVTRVFNSFNNVSGHNKRWDGRINQQVQFNFDDYIRFGAAFAMIPANYIQAPPGWADNMLNYDAAKWGCWGNVHEFGHHFQWWWGTPGTGETTNNAANFITYSLITEIDSSRQTDMKGTYWVEGGGWNWVTHEYSTIDFRNGYNGPLVFFGNDVYWFGQLKWRETLHRHTHLKDFKRGPENSYLTEFLLTCSKNFKRDMRPYFATFEFFDMKKEINQKAHELLNKWKYPEFHPVTNIYAVGFKYEGLDEFETHKPYAIGARAPYYFDFTKTMKTRTGMHKFKCIDVKPGVGKFEKMGEGKYKYTPPSNISVVDKFYVTYQDQQNTSSMVDVIVKIRQIVKGCRTSYMALPKGTYKDALAGEKAYYNSIQTGTEFPTVMRFKGGIRVPKINNNDAYMPWIGVTEGVFIPKNTTTYTFSFKFYYHLAFYLSENTLTGDPDKDAEYRRKLLTEKDSNAKFDDKHATEAITLTAGKKYNFRLVVLGTKKGGWAEVAVKINSKGPYQPVKDDMLYYPECSDEDRETWKFLPLIEQEPTFGKYYDSLRKNIDKTTIKVVQAPDADDKKFDWKTMLLNGNTQEKNSKSSNKGFPYVYVLDFGKPQSFNNIWGYFPGNAPMDLNLSFYCDGNNTINSTFNKNTANIFGKSHFHTCSKLEIRVISNKKGNYVSFNEFLPELTMDIISTRNIVPATHTGFSVNNNKKCKLTSAGLYYNGKGWHLESGCSLKIDLMMNETGNDVGVIGDRSHKNGGVFDFLIDGKKVATVDTSEGVKPEYKNTNYSMYQQFLAGVRGIQNTTRHNFEIKVTSGTVRIAGLLANTNSTMVHDASFIDGAKEGPNSDKNNNNKLTTQYVVALIISALTGFVVLVYAGFVVYKKWIEVPSADPF